MPEVKKVSPLLDEFALGKPFSRHHGVVCYPAVHSVTDEKFILKCVSIPESQTKVDALILTGACVDKAAAQVYYEEVADTMVRELQTLKELAQTRGFAPIYDYQLTKKDAKQVGMDLWILSPYRTTLSSYLRRGAVTHLDAVNMGIDVCASLTLCRKAGYLYQNLRPENIYITPQRKFQLGDLGLLALDELTFAMLPDRYHSDYTPPELEDTMAEPNPTMDIYALGMVLYQLYNGGQLPDRQLVIAGGELPAPTCADEEMAGIIARAIAGKPDARWQSPEEMGQALVSYLQGNVVNDTPIVPAAAQTPDTAESPAEDTPQESDGEDLTADAPKAENPPEVAADSAPQEETAPAEPDFTPVPPEPELGFTPVEPELQHEEDEESTESAESDTSAAPVADTELEDILTRAASFLEREAVATPAENPTPEAQPAVSVASDNDGEPAQAPDGDKTEEVPDAEDEEYTDEDEDDEEDEETTAGQKKAFRGIVIAVCVLVCLALAFMGGYFYYQNIYCVAVETFQAVGSTLDTLTVEVNAGGDEDLLTISCKDAFGNAHPADIVNGKATFTGLQPNTQYIVTLDVEGFHKLVGSANISFTTAILTEISDFTAVTGACDGSAVLTFTPNGTEPDAWFVTYSAEGEEEKTLTFTGHTVTITGLTVGKEYTFKLTADNDICLSGADTLTHTARAVVVAQNITMVDYTKTTMTIGWDEPVSAVGKWFVRCYNAAGFDTTVETDKCSVVFDDLDPAEAYSFEVTAEGMTESAIFSVTANPVFIQEIQVDDSIAGELTVSWFYVGNAPEKWLLMYAFGDDATQTVALQTEETVIKIDPALPNATYSIQIQPADGSSVFNGSHQTKTSQAQSFSGFGTTAEKVTISTFPAPEDADWTSGEIDPETLTTTFKTTDIIAFALEIDGKYDYTDAEVEALIVIRDADGNPVDFTYGTYQWHTMWTNDHYLGQTPRTPQNPAEYTLEIYFNNQLVCAQGITIAG